jgi:GNAT superfamily N-acetyltransferase
MTEESDGQAVKPRQALMTALPPKERAAVLCLVHEARADGDLLAAWPDPTINETVIVIGDPLEPIGICTLSFAQPGVARIRSLVVRDRFRLQGYGRALVSAALVAAEARNARTLAADVPTESDCFAELLLNHCDAEAISQRLEIAVRPTID